MKKIINFIILGLLVFILLAGTSLSVSGNNNHLSETSFDPIDLDENNPLFTNVLIRVDTKDKHVSLPKDMEVLGGKPGEWVNVITPQFRLAELSAANIEYSVLISDVDAYSQSFAGQYHTLAEIEQILSDIASNYPDITDLYSIGTTYQGRDIWCLEITDNPGVDEGEPGVFFMGLHHAREWPTVEICLNIADKLTSQYGIDPDITDVVDNRRLWLVTVVNPDGYYYCHDEGHDWRKNRHYFTEFDTWGVDLNRNYYGSNNGDIFGAWGSLVGYSSIAHNPDSAVYCGPSPFSELETQAIRDIFLENDISASITWHTSGELVMWPWGYSVFEQTPDKPYMSWVGSQIAYRITRQSGSGTYYPKQSAELYPTTGDTTDWAYGYAQYIQGKTTFAYTIEACNEFHPPAYELDQIIDENFDGALYLLQEAENIRNVVPGVLPPEIEEMFNDSDGNYTVLWQQQNPAAEPDYFQLDELTDLSILTDDAESGSNLWELNGFSLSDTRSQSGTYSYKSRYMEQDVSSMTSKYPIPITEGMSLSFWCWYDIEEDWDYAFVEVSTNGRSYDIFEKFTGSSGGWELKEYDLGDYVGNSIFVRFRYTTDQEVTEEGFYVDDISPIANFGTVTTLSNSIVDDYYEIIGRPNGTYYYMVKGHNNEKEWGDFSTLSRMIVGDSGDHEPPAVEITYPKKKYLYIMNSEIIPFLTTLIVGDIDIRVNALDLSGLNRVEFYIDDQLMETVTASPYNWTWSDPAFFKRTIKVVAFDNFGNDAETEIDVWKLF